MSWANHRLKLLIGGLKWKEVSGIEHKPLAEKGKLDDVKKEYISGYRKKVAFGRGHYKERQASYGNLKEIS